MKRRMILAATIVALLINPVRADEALPPDLAAVPGGAAGFLHVRVAELWKADVFKELRKVIDKAGPKALAAFDERFIPAPSTIDRITVVMLNPDEAGRNGPPFVGIVACNKPFDRDKMLKSILPAGKEHKAGDLAYFADEEVDLGIRVIDDRTFAIASTDVLRTYLEIKDKSPGGFAPALREAAKQRHLVLALNSSLLPGEAIAELPEPLQPLARAKMVQLGVNIGDAIVADLRVSFGDEVQAKSGETAAAEGKKLAREALKKAREEMEKQLNPPNRKGTSPITELPEAALAVAALGAIEHVEGFLNELPIKREGAELSASVKIPAQPYMSVLGLSALSAGFALPAVQKVRFAAERSRSANNLKQMMLAFHNYHDSFNGMPPAAICDQNGKPLLSWRVAILPYIEQDNLYKQFKLDEPWDSEHNKKLLPMMPKIYAMPNAGKAAEPMTHFRVFYGNGAALELKRGVRIADFLDGSSNTGVIFETTEAVEWTKPDGLEYDPKKPLPKFGKMDAENFWVAMGDGSVRSIRKKTPETTIHALITRNGGEVFTLDD